MNEQAISTDLLLSIRNNLSKIVRAVNKELEKRNPTKIVDEAIFIINYADRNSPKLGNYQLATAEDNREKFNIAFNILMKANARIDNRYHGKNYKHSFWIFHDKIYRQKLTE